MNSIEIALRIDGKLYSCRYIVEDMGAFTLEDMMVRATYQGKSKAAKVAALPPDKIASVLLRELVRRSRAKRSRAPYRHTV